MKASYRVFAVIAVLLGVFSALSPFAYGSHYKIVVVHDKNGKIPLTTLNLTFRVGSADDPAVEKGIASATARLIREGGALSWKGLPARTRSELESFLYPYAADMEMNVGKEQISFELTVPASDAEKMLQLLAQLVLRPAFMGSPKDPKESESLRASERELQRILSEEKDFLEKQLPQEDQEELGKAVLDQLIFGENHPYAHVAAGTLSGLKNINLEKVRRFYLSHMVQPRLTVGVSGVVSAEVLKLAREAFKELPAAGSSKASLPQVRNSDQVELLIVKGSFKGTGVHLGFPLPFNRSANEFAEMYLAANAFGKHRSFVGRLMDVVRETRGINYGTYAYVEDFPYGGHLTMEPTQAARAQQAFTIWGRPTAVAENGCFLLRQLHRELTVLAEKGLTRREFDLTKSHLIGYIPLLGMSLDRQLGYAIDSHFYGIRGDYLKRLQSEVESAKHSVVNALLKKHIKPKALQIVVTTADPEKFRAEILGPRCAIRYEEGVQKAPNVLKEDKQIAVHSIGIKPENIRVVDSESLFQ
ncbi:MAG: pitrilysin family protein [Bdellovibrionota bacterium]